MLLLLTILSLLFPFRIDLWGGNHNLFAHSAAMDMIKKGVTYDAVGAVKSCLFCRIISREEPATLVYEDAQFIVFKTIAPATKKHLLISPKEHIQNLRSLSGSDGVLVRDLIKVARVALGNDAEGEGVQERAPITDHRPQKRNKTCSVIYSL